MGNNFVCYILKVFAIGNAAVFFGFLCDSFRGGVIEKGWPKFGSIILLEPKQERETFIRRER